MSGQAVVEQQSHIDAPVERVWARVVTPEGINDELRPWMTMSMPRGAESLTVDSVPVGEPIGRCWLRLFGVVPFDYDDLTIAELRPGQGFHEESTMLSMRLCRHERTLEPEVGAKTVPRSSHVRAADAATAAETGRRRRYRRVVRPSAAATTATLRPELNS